MKPLAQISIELRALCDDLRAHREVADAIEAPLAFQLHQIQADLWNVQRCVAAIAKSRAESETIPPFPVCGE